MTGPLRFAAARIATGTAAFAATTPTAAAASRLTDVVVDLNLTPSRASIVRDGREVATPVANPERAATALENFIPIARIAEPRSVRQSIAPGTLVSRGTAVDLDFLAPENVTLGIFEGVHADLRTRSVPSLAALLQDPEVTGALSKDELTAADRQNLTAKLATANVTVDDAVPDRSLGAAITGLRTAQAFR